MTTTTQATGAEEVAWDLSDLYDSPDDPKLQGELDEAKQATTAFRERYRGKVAELDAAGLAEAVAERERIESLLDRPMTYAQLRFSTNMADPPRSRRSSSSSGSSGPRSTTSTPRASSPATPSPSTATGSRRCGATARISSPSPRNGS